MYDKILVGYDNREKSPGCAGSGRCWWSRRPPEAAYIYETQPPWSGQEHGHQREHHGELERIRARLVSDAEALNYGGGVDISYVGSSSAAAACTSRPRASGSGGDRLDPSWPPRQSSDRRGRRDPGHWSLCAIAVAPSGFARTPQRRLGIVGCGYDGSSESQSALRTAYSLARRKGATMRAIGVVEWRDGLRDRLREELEALDDSVEVEELILGEIPPRNLPERLRKRTCSWSGHAATVPCGGRSSAGCRTG